MYVKQNEASDVHETPNIHPGEGVILRRSMFREQSKLPIRMEVWELEPGVSEGDHTHEGNGELEEIYYFLTFTPAREVILRRSMFREQSKLPIRMEVWELEPGVSEGDHTHEGNGELEEIYYFLEGEGVMSVEGEDVPIAAGDSIMVPPGVDHGFRNTGDSLLKLVLTWGKPAA